MLKIKTLLLIFISSSSGKGIQPEYFIDQSIPDYQWIDYVNNVLNEIMSCFKWRQIFLMFFRKTISF